MQKKKVLAFNTVRAPYRVDLYNQLGRHVDLTVCFEQKHDPVRSEKWYSNDFKTFEGVCLKKWDKDLRYLKTDVLKVLKKGSYDLVYMSEWSSVTALTLMLGCILLGVPYILSMDGYIKKANIDHYKIKNRIKRFFAVHALATIGTGKSTAEYANSIGFTQDKIYSIGFTSLFEKEILKNILQDDEKSRIKLELGLANDVRYIVSVGRLVYGKGMDLLLNAWSKLENRDGWELLIIGDGTEWDKYLDDVQSRGWTDVHILHEMPKKQLFQYYQASDIFVLNTREDVWGLVINEAMANGLPVITTRQCIAGVELIKEGESGFLHECDDTENCATHMKELMDDDALRMQMAKNNVSKIKDYTIESEANKIVRIINTILK